MPKAAAKRWQAAAARIVAQAAVHAPDTPVFPLSAREYAEGLLTGNDELMAQSRFAEFFAALDASLVATTGRSRLRRAAAEARRIATRAADALALDVAALGDRCGDAGAPSATALEPLLAAVDAAAAAGRATLIATGAGAARAKSARAARRCAMHCTARSRARSTPPTSRGCAIARSCTSSSTKRSRARWAASPATSPTSPPNACAPMPKPPSRRSSAKAALPRAWPPMLAAVAAERLPITEDAARAFDADPASGAWSVDLETGLRGTIVLSALGGPSVSLVSAIAARFASRPNGAYMKRELIADLNADLYTAFDAEVARFVADIGTRVERVAGGLAERVAAIAGRVRLEALGAIDRALELERSGDDPAAAARRLRAVRASGRAARDADRNAERALRARKPRRAARTRRCRRYRSTPMPAANASIRPAFTSIRTPTSTGCARNAGAWPSSARSSAASRA